MEMKFISHALSEPEIPKLSNYIQLPIGIHHNCVFLLLFSSFLQVITTQTKCSHLNDIGVSGGTRNFLTSLPAISFPFARTMSGEGQEGGRKGGRCWIARQAQSLEAHYRHFAPQAAAETRHREK